MRIDRYNSIEINGNDIIVNYRVKGININKNFIAHIIILDRLEDRRSLIDKLLNKKNENKEDGLLNHEWILKTVMEEETGRGNVFNQKLSYSTKKEIYENYLKMRGERNGGVKK